MTDKGRFRTQASDQSTFAPTFLTILRLSGACVAVAMEMPSFTFAVPRVT